jgi:hypothetical protein
VQYVFCRDPATYRRDRSLHPNILTAWHTAQAVLFPKLRALLFDGRRFWSMDGMKSALNLIAPHVSILSLDIDPQQAEFLEHLRTNHPEEMDFI